MCDPKDPRPFSQHWYRGLSWCDVLSTNPKGAHTPGEASAVYTRALTRLRNQIESWFSRLSDPSR